MKKYISIVLTVVLLLNCFCFITAATSEAKNYTQLSDFDMHSNSSSKPSDTDTGIKTSSGALKLQALDEKVEYASKTFDDFYNSSNYNIYGSRYTLANYGVTFDAVNSSISTVSGTTKIKLNGTGSMTDFKTAFTVTSTNSAAMYAGVAFRMNDSDFGTNDFATQGYMVFVYNASGSTDVRITFRRYLNYPAKRCEEFSETYAGLLSATGNPVDVTVTVTGEKVIATACDSTVQDAAVFSKEYSLRPSDTKKGIYRESGSFAFVTNGNHKFENISLSGTVATNTVVNKKSVYDIYDNESYSVYGDQTSLENYGATFKEGRISTAGKSKIKLNNYTSVADFDADFKLTKTNGNYLYGGIGFHLQDVGFNANTFNGAGYLLFAKSAPDSMDVQIILRNALSTTYEEKTVVNIEGILSAPSNGVRIKLSVRGNSANLTVYDAVDDSRFYTVPEFSLSSTNSKAGNYKSGSLAFISNGTHDYTEISLNYFEEELPFTTVENFDAYADYTLPESASIQVGMMFYVQDTANLSPGLEAFSLNAIRTSSSADNAITLQVIRYGTTASGQTLINLGAMATDAVSGILSNAKGNGDNIRIKLKVARGTAYYSVVNLATGKESKTYTLKLDKTSTINNTETHNTEYKSGGIGAFTNIANTVLNNFKVTKLADCKVDFTEYEGGTATGDDIYAYSEAVTVTANPDYGYYFDGWYDGETFLSEQLSYTFTATQSISLTPKFVAFPLRYSGIDNSNTAAVITIDSVENVTEVGVEVTVKAKDREESYVVSSNYINEKSENQNAFIATADKVYYCDIDGDGTVEVSDLAQLRKELINNSVISDLADLNEDTKIDVRDIIRLKKVFADEKLEFNDEFTGYIYPFVIADRLEAEGKQYIEIYPYSIANGKKAYGAPRYFSYDSNELTRNSHSENHTPFGKVRVACVGDSITQGVGATGWSSGDYTYAYPEQLGTILSEDCIVGNFGRGSSYVYYYEGRNESLWYPNTIEYKESNEFDPDIVIIMLGTNDARVTGDDDAALAWESQFADIVSHYKTMSGNPEVYVTNSLCMHLYNAEFDTSLRNYIHPKQKAVADRFGCNFLDTYYDLYDIMETGGGLASDKLHPCDIGYRAMAEYFASKINTDIFF